MKFIFGQLEKGSGGARDINRLIDKLVLQPASLALAVNRDTLKAKFVLDDLFFDNGRVLVKEVSDECQTKEI